ncbi:MAG: FitA-like ribbon-helix-helix domain-containing protein [Chthoniobacterales bacterium]
MITLTIKNLEPDLTSKLRLAAASHQWTIEEEARNILNEHFKESAPAGGMGDRIHARFAAIGGIELELPSRAGSPRFATFD